MDMENRRKFIKKGAMLFAGGAFASAIFSACSNGKKNIGLQLYSLRYTIQEQGIEKVLELVSKMGYTTIETAGYNDGKIYGLLPEEFKKCCDNAGLKISSAHVGREYVKENEQEIMAWWDKAIDAHAKLNVKYMIQPWMPKNHNTMKEDLKIYCDYFNAIGIKTAAQSILFGYHNHVFEFEEIEGEVIFDYLLRNTSKNHVCFELDVYWAVVGGKNPVEYIQNYPEQIRSLHIKDEKEIGASGKMDFKSIFEAAAKNNIKDWYVEIERYSKDDPILSAQESYDFLNKASYVF